MIRETQNLLAAFDRLPAEEQRAFTEEVVRRSAPSTPARSPEKRSAPPRPLCGNRSTTRKMATPRRGEVWLVDFGQAGKTRPAVVVSVALGDQERPLLTVVPHTTALRGSPFEIAVRASFLNTGGFLVQGVTTFPTARALHRLGSLPAEDFDRVFQGLLRWLGHFPEH